MYYNPRQIGTVRYTAVFPSPSPDHNVSSTIETAVYRWPKKHHIAALVAVLVLLFAATSGIFVRASQLAVYNPPSASPSEPKIVREVNIPVVQALAKPEIPQAQAVLTDNEELLKIINDWVANHPSNNWSIAVAGLGDDTRFASYNTDKKRNLASVYKLFLMYPLLQKVSLDQFDQTYINVDGTSQTLGYCVDAMLRNSNNPCGEAVGRYVGWAHADSVLNGLGFSHTELYSDYGTQSSASDTLKLLRELYSGTMFTDAQRQYIINILKVQTKRSGIPAGCSGCTVADKTGSLSYVNNDAGIVYYADKNYVLSIFTDGAGFDKIASLTSQIHDQMSKP